MSIWNVLIREGSGVRSIGNVYAGDDDMVGAMAAAQTAFNSKGNLNLEVQTTVAGRTLSSASAADLMQPDPPEPEPQAAQVEQEPQQAFLDTVGPEPEAPEQEPPAAIEAAPEAEPES